MSQEITTPVNYNILDCLMNKLMNMHPINAKDLIECSFDETYIVYKFSDKSSFVSRF